MLIRPGRLGQIGRTSRIIPRGVAARRINAAASWGVGRLTPTGWGAVSLSSTTLGLRKPGAEAPVSWTVGAPSTGTSAHWLRSNTVTPVPTAGGAGLPDGSYVFPVTATFADGSIETADVTITPVPDVLTVGDTDNMTLLGSTYQAAVNGKTIEWAAGINYTDTFAGGSGAPGRRIINGLRFTVPTVLRAHDQNRMGWPIGFLFQQSQFLDLDDFQFADLDMGPVDARIATSRNGANTEYCENFRIRRAKFPGSGQYFTSASAAKYVVSTKAARNFAFTDCDFQYVAGLWSGGGTTEIDGSENISFNRCNIRYYLDNGFITGYGGKQELSLLNCTFMSPMRVDPGLHGDGGQIHDKATSGTKIFIRNWRLIQADGTMPIQGYYGGNADNVASADDAPQSDIDGMLFVGPAVSAVLLKAAKDSSLRHIQTLYHRNSPDPVIDPTYANAAGVFILPHATIGAASFGGSNLLDNVVAFGSVAPAPNSSWLYGDVLAHGGSGFDSGTGAAMVNPAYVSGNFYVADPTAALAALPYASMTLAQIVAAVDALNTPKADGAYKRADGAYRSMLTPAGALSTDVVYAAPFVDTFDAPTGKLSARSGWQVEARSTLATHANGLEVVTAGTLSGSVGGVGAGAIGSHTDAPLATVSTRFSVLPVSGYGAHQATVAADNLSYLRCIFSQISTTSGFVQFAAVLNNVQSGSGGISAAQFRPEPGDVLTVEYFSNAGTTYARPRINGRRIVGTDMDMTASGLALSGKFGVTGNLLANSVDSFVSGDPSVKQVLVLFAPNRVVQTDSAGNVVWKLSASYSQPVNRLKYRVVNETAGAVVTGHDGALVANLQASGGVATFGLQANPPIPAVIGGVVQQYHVEIYQDNLSGGIARADGPVQRGGDVLVHNGQSNSVNANGVTATTATYAAPANSLKLDGTAVSVPELRRQLPIVANTPMAAEALDLMALTGRPVTIMQGGTGGTTAAQRAPGNASGLHTALLDGIDHAGGRVLCILDDGGEAEAATPTAWLPAMDLISASVDAKVGYAVPMLLCPVGNARAAGNTDANYETLRRTQWAATQSNPARYRIACWKMDLEVKTTAADSAGLHLTDQAYAELRKREARAAAKLKGLVAFDLSGPTLASVAKVDAQTLAVTINLNGFDGLEVANGAVNGNWNGGLRFAVASTFATPLTATGVTFGAASAGKMVATFTFAANSFPGAAFVSGPYGRNPFNPANVQTINDNWLAQAAILRGTKAGEYPVAIQPYYSAAGDYITTP